MSSSGVNLKKFIIPPDEVIMTTEKLSSETVIREDESSKFYKGFILPEDAKPRVHEIVAIKWVEQYYSELKIVSTLEHENIIHCHGYSHKDGREILVFEYPGQGSLDQYLSSKSFVLTWEDRLKICIGAARGLEYLHSGLGDHKRVIHRDFKSANIMLNENLEAKICGFDFSILVDPKQPQVHEHAMGTLSYLDPIYLESGIVNTELDVYSFGVVLFEMVSGMLRFNGNRMQNVHPQTLISLVRHCQEDGLDKLLTSSDIAYLSVPSFHLFKEIAYKCISLKLEDRPRMSMIVKRLEEALAIANQKRADSTIITRSDPHNNIRESNLVPLEEIKLATEDFSPKSLITPDLSPNELYVARIGQLSERWQNRKAIFKCYIHEAWGYYRNEVELLHRFKNENIIAFIGLFDDPHDYAVKNFIVVHEYGIKGSLFDHLRDVEKRCCLTWATRLEIAIGAARGLKYLHSGLGKQAKVIHTDVKSENILLDEKLEAKISSFGLSVLVHPDQPQVYRDVRSTQDYTDPIWSYSSIVKLESDVYSFGVVLFETLTGKLAHEETKIGDTDQTLRLIDLVQRYHYDGRLEELIDPLIRKEINIDSFRAFMKIAYRCISLTQKDRPTMNRILSRLEEAQEIQKNGAASNITKGSQKLESYLIPLNEIRLATNDFSLDGLRGDGGFGKVYEGQLSERWQNRVVAIKSLDPKGQQGYNEFKTELEWISKFRHENIIPFVGYCDEDNHMIIVTEYASNHSLDHHLQKPDKRSCLTWAHRLKICLGAARGLNYLHSNRVIHRDIKSGNILLDKDMEARICDFGLSKQNLINQQGTHINTNAVGTNFYLDPFYREGGILREASDVYSFGVVLFEILSGMMAYNMRSLEGGKRKPLINLVRQYYADQIEMLVDPSIANQIDSRCLHTFKEIAFKCISFIPKERPTMDIIIERIEDAMEFQGLEC